MYVREGNLTWQDEFDGVYLDAAAQEEAGEGVMGLEYWWQHEEVSLCLSSSLSLSVCIVMGLVCWRRHEEVSLCLSLLVSTLS